MVDPRELIQISVAVSGALWKSGFLIIEESEGAIGDLKVAFGQGLCNYPTIQGLTPGRIASTLCTRKWRKVHGGQSSRRPA